MQRLVLPLIFLFFFLGCDKEKESNSWSIVHADSLNSKFLKAEELMVQGNFTEAANEYHLLKSKNLKPIESDYALLNEKLAYLLENDSAYIKEKIEIPGDPKLLG